MAKVEARVLKGFRDYLPAKMIPRQRMLSAVEGKFQSFGFVPLQTPALEYYEILAGKYGEEGESLLYRFQDQGQRDVALRYDLTVPLARVVAQYSELILPFRRYQIAPVWRAEKPQRGRFREFMQCDGDIVGSGAMTADAEILQLGCELLLSLGVDRFRIVVNNRKILTGMLELARVKSPQQETVVLRTLDKLLKIGSEKVRELLRKEAGLESDQCDRILGLIGIQGDAPAVLAELERLFGVDDAGRQGVGELRRVYEILEAVGLEKRIKIDPSVARGLNYYTGTIYETFLDDLPGYGAVMSGGRYDGLIGIFKGQQIPGVGISLGIDRLVEGLVELKLLREQTAVVSILVTVFDEGCAAYSSRVARVLRAGGIACELFPALAKIGKQLRYAQRREQRWVVVAGPDEAAAERVSVKDLDSGAQETIALADLVEYAARMTGTE